MCVSGSSATSADSHATDTSCSLAARWLCPSASQLTARTTGNTHTETYSQLFPYTDLTWPISQPLQFPYKQLVAVEVISVDLSGLDLGSKID